MGGAERAQRGLGGRGHAPGLHQQHRPAQRGGRARGREGVDEMAGLARRDDAVGPAAAEGARHPGSGVIAIGTREPSHGESQLAQPCHDRIRHGIDAAEHDRVARLEPLDLRLGLVGQAVGRGEQQRSTPNGCEGRGHQRVDEMRIRAVGNQDRLGLARVAFAGDRGRRADSVGARQPHDRNVDEVARQPESRAEHGGGERRRPRGAEHGDRRGPSGIGAGLHGVAADVPDARGQQRASDVGPVRLRPVGVDVGTVEGVGALGQVGDR